MESVIDVHGVQLRKSVQMVTHPDINPVKQDLTSVNRREPVFPLVLPVYGVGFGQSRSGRLITNSVYTWVSEWHICISESPQETRFYASRIHEFEKVPVPEDPKKKKKFKQSREPTNSTHMWWQVWQSNPGQIGGKWLLSPLCHPCYLECQRWAYVSKLPKPVRIVYALEGQLRFHPTTCPSNHATLNFSGSYCSHRHKPGGDVLFQCWWEACIIGISVSAKSFEYRTNMAFKTSINEKKKEKIFKLKYKYVLLTPYTKSGNVVQNG